MNNKRVGAGMAKAETVRTSKLGKVEQRLVDFDGIFQGTADEGAKPIVHLQRESAKTGAAIADLGPRDNINLQSFIWVVGEYTVEERHA